MRFDWRWFSALALAFVVTAPDTARAGTPDLLVQIAPRPADSDLIVLAYEYGGDGLFYSRDRGETYSVLCSSAISEPDGDGGFIFVNGLKDTIVTGDGHVLAGDTRGLWSDDGNLCNWTRVDALKNQWVTSLVHDPRDADVVYGVLATSASEDNGLFRRNADGSIERVGEGSPIKIYSLLIAERPDGGLRFYQAAVVGSMTVVDHDAQLPLPDGGTGPREQEKQLYALRYSDDEGESWTEHAVETEIGTSVTLEAIDPADHERLVFRVQRNGTGSTDTLMIAEQGGAMQRSWLELGELSGVAIEPSGTVWIAGQGEGDGVQRAAAIGEAPSVVRESAAFCIGLHGEDLELCDRMDYGVADKATGMLSPPRLFDTADRVHSCEGVDLVEQCRVPFCAGRCAGNHWPESPMCADNYESVVDVGCATDSVVVPPDAGRLDGGGVIVDGADAGARDAGSAAPDGSAMTPRSESSGCGCSVPGVPREQRAPASLVALLLATWLAARRTRRS